jgi:hypothetical protein
VPSGHAVLQGNRLIPVCKHTLQDKKLRIYSRNSSLAYVAAVNDAFERWVQVRFSGIVKPVSPYKSMAPRKRKAEDLTQESTESRTLFPYSL